VGNCYQKQPFVFTVPLDFRQFDAGDCKKYC